VWAVEARPEASRLRYRQQTRPKEVTLLYWLMVAVIGGVGFGWVNVRRRRKAADAKTA
jgi:hypothetical protein